MLRPACHLGPSSGRVRTRHAAPPSAPTTLRTVPAATPRVGASATQHAATVSPRPLCARSRRPPSSGRVPTQHAAPPSASDHFAHGPGGPELSTGPATAPMAPSPVDKGHCRLRVLDRRCMDLDPGDRARHALPLTTAQHRRAGVTSRRLASADFRRLHHGVHVDAAAGHDIATIIQAASLLLPPDGAIGGWAAAWWHGVDRIDGARGRLPVLLCLPQPGRRRRAGVASFRSALAPGDVVSVDGIRVTSPLRTCFDLVRRSVERDDRVAAIDAFRAAGLVTRGRPRLLRQRAPRVARCRTGDAGRALECGRNRIAAGDLAPAGLGRRCPPARAVGQSDDPRHPRTTGRTSGPLRSPIRSRPRIRRWLPRPRSAAGSGQHPATASRATRPHCGQIRARRPDG